MSVDAYAEYKESGVEWLGRVPQHWTTSKIKYAYRFSTGWTPPTGDSANYDGDNIWVNISDLGPRVISDAAKRLSDAAIEKTDIALSPAGSLLFSFKLSIGQVSFAGCDLYTNEAIASFPPQDGVNLEFAFYAFPLFIVKNASENIYGAKMLNQELIRSALICLPPLPEQSDIATFLDRETGKIDALVEEQRRLIALLKEKRQAVISHAVTKGLNPNAPMKDSGIEWLGEVPAHWEVKRFKHLISSIEQGWSPQCEASPAETENDWAVLKVGCVNGGLFNPEENKTLPPELAPIESLGISEGDLLISRANTRELVGSAALATKAYPRLMLCDKLYRLRFDTATTLPQFASFYLATPGARGQIEVAATGASSSMVNIGQSTILEMEIAVPPVAEQSSICLAAMAQGADFRRLVDAAETAVALLVERRAALISAAVTGKIDVRGMVAALATKEAA